MDFLVYSRLEQAPLLLPSHRLMWLCAAQGLPRGLQTSRWLGPGPALCPALWEVTAVAYGPFPSGKEESSHYQQAFSCDNQNQVGSFPPCCLQIAQYVKDGPHLQLEFTFHPSALSESEV